MMRMPPGRDFGEWREKARGLLAAGIPPERVLWEDAGHADLFEETPMPPPAAAATGFRIPAFFVPLADAVACHGDPRRWALLYRLLWRLTRGGEKHLLNIASDPDVATARRFGKNVRREIHKMHAFVRFRKAGEDEAGRETYTAWFEPEHWIVAAAAPFFRDRFANMDWSIFTPRGCAHWIGGEMTFAPGVDKDPCESPEMLEEIWRTYYRSIFNPARLKVRMMRSEMPARYWKNLPEARLIPELIRHSAPRVKEMFATPERAPRSLENHAYLRGLYAEPEPEDARMPSIARDASLEELSRRVQTCRACPLWERATCAVFGAGPPDARLMIVGEQPGDHEDLAGRPFVGPAGALLDRALAEAGLDRSAAYVTNAVKHFKWEPRGKRRLHRNPGDGEIEACRPWLLAELSKVAPDVLIFLGGTAARSLLGKETKVTRDRGWIEGSPLAGKVILTVHPSFLLRNPDGAAREREYARFVADLRLAADPPSKL